MSSHIHSPRDNGGVIMGVKSPAWFREWFGDYDTSKFDANGTCAHCGRHDGRYGAGALSGNCYLGLCADCWCALLWHCLEVVNRQIDKHPEKWNGDERPDGLQLALHKIRRNVELGTFGLLCEVAIDGAPNTRLKEAQREAVRKERNRAKSRRYYQQHREKVRAQQKAYRDANLEKCRECNRRWAKAHSESIHANNRKWNLANSEKVNAYQREWARRNRDKINAYRRKWYRKQREEKNNGQQDV